MGNKRIIAYFMHEHEQAHALSLMPQGQTTESYVIGEIDEAQIPALETAGIICHEVAKSRKAETPGMMFESRTAGARAGAPGIGGAPGFGGAAGLPPVSRSARTGAAQVYLIQLQGPLLEEWRTQLSALGVNLLEYVPPGAYTARLTTGQIASVSQLSFVGSVDEYGPRDTGPVVGLESAAPPPRPAATCRSSRLTRDCTRHRIRAPSSSG